MKCVILCMCCNEPHYMQQYHDITETWGKDIINGKYSNLDIYGYTAAGNGEIGLDKESHMIYVPSGDSLNYTFDKTAKAIQYLDLLGIEYDCILRTNCSTIINAKLLSEFINSRVYDPTKVYTAELYISNHKSAPYDGCPCLKGNLWLLSREYTKLINECGLAFAKQLNNYDRIIFKNLFDIDDTAISSILNTYLIMHNKKLIDTYRILPVQYTFAVNVESFNNNCIAYINKPITELRKIDEYYDTSKMTFDNFYINYYQRLNDDLDVIASSIDASRYLYLIQDNNITVVSFEDYDR